MNKDQDLITAQQLADMLSLSVETIWRYTREERIPYVKLGQKQYRYNKQAVLTALSGDRSVIKEDEATYKSKRKLTYANYAELPEEPGYRYEIIEGELIRDPTPTFQHQRVSRRLRRVIEDYLETVDPGGEVFSAPLDLVLTKHTVVQPDLLYLPSSRPAKNNPVDSLPELIVEVLSPPTSRKDRVKKMDYYRKVGVPHYWMVDPEEELVDAYELRDGYYVSMVRAFAGTFSHPSFPGLSFEIRELFQKPSRSQSGTDK